jgi:TatD DNase family protein
MLVDSHCHLDFPDFAAERDAVMERARRAGVGHFLTISTHMETLPKVRAVAEAYDDVSFTVGVHPHEAERDQAVAQAALAEYAGHEKAVGIGETGLDYFYDNSPRDLQIASFRKHIRVALETKLPLIVHTRDADADTMRILREEAAGANLNGLLHCFSSGPQLAEEAVDFGFSISFSGIVTFKKADELRETAKRVPAERLLVETDAPFLAPVPKRGLRNEPAFVVHTASCLAELRGLSPQALGELTSANFFRLFTKAVPAAAVS